MAAKYKQQFQDMLAAHPDVFTSFYDIHDKFVLDPDQWREQFNKEGANVLLLIQRYDNNLCAKSEGGKYGKFSEKLSEKFWQEVRLHFPKIDYVGMTVAKNI